MLKRVKNVWQNIRQNIRQLSGDDAYERYLAHYSEHLADHQAGIDAENLEPPLSREAFFKQWQDDKWKGVKRCC